jgi:uncharacterized membrane protein
MILFTGDNFLLYYWASKINRLNKFLMNFFKNKFVLGSVLFIVALSLRIPGMTFHSLWFDEASTAFVVSQPVSNVLKTINTIEATPPLFFFLEKIGVAVFHGKLSEFSLRLLPVVFGALSCVLFFFLFKEIPNKKVEYYAFFLLTISNFHIATSQDARAYSLLVLMVFASLFFTLLWWKKPSVMRSIIFFLSIALTVQVHYYAVLWVMALFLAVLFAKPKNKQLMIFLGLTAVAGCFSFAPLISLFMAQIGYELNPVKDYLMEKWLPGIFYSPIKVLIGAYLFKIPAIQDISLTDLLGIVPVLVILALVIYTFTRRMKRKEVSDAEKIITYSFIASFALHAVIGWKVPTIHPQYMVHFLVLLFGCMFLNLPSRYAFKAWSCVLLAVFNIMANVRYYNPSIPYLDPWREIAAAIDNHIAEEGSGSEPIISEYPTCVSIGFYLKNKDAPLFQTYSPFCPKLKNNYARLNLFGNIFFTDLFHFRYFPIERRASLNDVMATAKCGILVERRSLPIETVHERLNATYKGAVDFSVFKIFNTNQGKIALLHWKVIQCRL